MRYTVCLILAILSSCSSQRDTKGIELQIDDPRLVDFVPNNLKLETAIVKITEHLIKQEVPVDSMYIVGIDSTTSNENWLFYLNGYYHYLEAKMYNDAIKGEDSLKEVGVKDYVIYVPPTGNWGLYDRTIYYSTKDESVFFEEIPQ